MFNLFKDCNFKSTWFSNYNWNLVIVLSSLLAVLSVSINVFASIGVWQLYQRHMTRTPKLLLLLFVTNCITVFAVELLYLYHFIDGFLQSWYFIIHLSLIVYLISWSSTVVFLVTLDRFLLVLRGKWYLIWKKNFGTLIFVATAFNIALSIYAFYGLAYMKCKENVIHLSVYGALLTLDLFLSLLINIKMIRNIRRKASVVGTVGINLRSRVAKTVVSMTLCSACFQALLVSVIAVVSSCFLTKIRFASQGGAMLFSAITMIVSHAGALPLIYIRRNNRMPCILRPSHV